MNRSLDRYTAIIFTTAIFAGACVAQPLSQALPATAPASAPTAPRVPQTPKNLKVLPENTDIRAVMHQYEADLGIHCSFCHAAPDETTHRTDFASDSNMTKDTARYMIQMTADLNSKYLANMPLRAFGDAITCGTCHRGTARPPFFVAPAENRSPGAMGATAPQATPNAAVPTGSSR